MLQIQNGCRPKDREVLGQMEGKIIEFTALWCVMPDGKLLFVMSLELVGVQSCEKSKWAYITMIQGREKNPNNRIISYE